MQVAVVCLGLALQGLAPEPALAAGLSTPGTPAPSDWALKLLGVACMLISSLSYSFLGVSYDLLVRSEGATPTHSEVMFYTAKIGEATGDVSSSIRLLANINVTSFGLLKHPNHLLCSVFHKTLLCMLYPESHRHIVEVMQCGKHLSMLHPKYTNGPHHQPAWYSNVDASFKHGAHVHCCYGATVGTCYMSS